MEGKSTAELVALGEEAMLLLQPGETIKQCIERLTKESLEQAHKLGEEFKKTLQVDGSYIRPCHWCDGTMSPTPTYGRLECNACGAVSIVGRAKPITHVEGRHGDKGRTTP